MACDSRAQCHNAYKDQKKHARWLLKESSFYFADVGFCEPEKGQLYSVEQSICQPECWELLTL